MKKLLFFLAPVMLVAGCAQDFEFAEPPATDAQDAMSEVRTRALDGAVYNEVVDAWMIPQADPYTLKNFQAAYDKLRTGKSAQKLTTAVAAEFAAAKKLSPTHYALKIYPKNEDEQWRVETMEDVQVAYIPFDYAQLTQEEVEKLPASKTRSIGTSAAAANTFAEKSPYTVTYDNYMTTDGGPTGPVTYQLPILYTVWPVSKPLPDDLEYVVDYEVFLPPKASKASLSNEAILSLEREAMAFALPGGGTTPIAAKFITITVTTFDDELMREVPITGLSVRYQIGSLIQDSTTGPDGRVGFALDTQFVLMTPTLIFTYLGNDDDMDVNWKITPENSANPLTYSKVVNLQQGPQIGYYYGNISLQAGNRRENEIHRAVHYFFHNQTDFPKYSTSGGLRIIAHPNPGPYEGAFMWYENYTATPWIEIYNNYSTDAQVVGTTLHELGHFTHYIGTGQGSSTYYYQNAHKGLRESFAPYVGWYLGENYYTSIGWTKPPASYYYPFGDITSDSRQGWLKTHRREILPDLGEYTPLFVDLADNYNQQAYYSFSAPNDEIDGVSPSVIWSIITTSTTWAQCRSRLQSIVGICYTTSEFENWVTDFDYWFAQPYNN